MSLGIALGFLAAVVLPILAARGKGWRGVWFGLCIPLFLVAYFIGSSPVETKSQTEAELGHAIDQQTYRVMGDFDDLALTLSLGAALGCLVGGCVYRPRMTVK